MTRHRLLAAARLEYLEAVRWYRDEVQDRELGRDFIEKFRQRVERIREVPRSGALVTGIPSQLEVRRAKLQRFPFHIFFSVGAEEIVIIAVAHEHREPGYWIDRLSGMPRREP